MGEKKKNTDIQKRTSKNYKLNLRISNDELELLNMISFEDDEPISQVVRKAIKQYDMLRKNRKHF